MSAAREDAAEGVDGYTVVLRQTRPAEKAADVDERVRGLLDVTASAPGYLGSVVLDGSTTGRPELYVVLRFADEDAWRAGADVSGRLDALARATGGQPAHQHAEGVAGWFDLPGTTTAQAPAKWKMALVTWCTIFPLLLVTNLALSPLSALLPRVVGLALGTAITTPVMTWFAMPAVTGLLRSWLFPSSTTSS